MALIDEVMTYARICDPQEDVVPLMDAAEAYVTGAMECKDFAQNQKNPLYRLAVKMLVCHWYDNREPVGQASNLSYGLEAILAQLQSGAKP